MSDLNLQDDFLRLQVYLARCGVASRRASEKIILDGRVSVNGTVIRELGTKVKPTDSVCVDGKKISFEKKAVYVLLNKPSGIVCSNSDEKGRTTANELLAEHFEERLYNVGRLDMYSSGLIIYTNDGEFTKKISHPSSQIEKEYSVEASTCIPDELLEKFEKGIRIEGVFYRAKKVYRLGEKKAGVVLTEGKNREIRRVFEKFGLGIKSLERVRIGNLNMDDLAAGDFRELSKTEVEGLLKLCSVQQ